MPKRTYSVLTDTTLEPYMLAQDSVPGEQAVAVQEDTTPAAKVRVIPAKDVRLKALKLGRRRAGAGFHELVPTDLRHKIIGKPVTAYLQSGARTSTDMTILANKSGGISGHTGMFPKAAGTGSTNTKGQEAAHDDLRAISLTAAETTTSESEVLSYLSASTRTLAHGRQILESDDLTGGIPNLAGAFAFEPVKSRPGRQRLRTARELHRFRETFKDRIQEQREALNQLRARAPSPPRGDLRDDGTGGDYLPPAQASQLRAQHRALSPPPEMEGTTAREKLVNLAAFPAQALRYGAEEEAKRFKGACPACGFRANYEYEKKCHDCNAPI